MRKILASASDQVIWHGYQPWAHLPHFYESADVLCLPTRYDGWGMVIPEALAAGLPVLTTRAAGAAEELVRDQLNGWLLDDADVTKLGQALNLIATLPPSKLVRMSQAARETVNPHHLEQGAERFVRLCHQTLAQFHCVQTNTLDEPFHSEAHPGWTLLVTGTYPADRLHSMERYANLATEAGEAANAQVLRVGCPFLLGRAFHSFGFVRKWAGHVDKYLLFPIKLRWLASRQRTPTLVHITDQGLAPLAAWVRDFPTLITCHDLIAISNSLTPVLPHP